MAKILCLETSSSICSAALVDNKQIIQSLEISEPNSHSKYLTLLVEQLFEESNIKKDDLEAICLSMGPGSYTGLRIGTSVAKGLAFALNIPVIGLSAAEVIAKQFIENKIIEEDALVCPMIDARRMEVYTQLFNSKGEALTELSPKILDESSYQDELDEHKMYFLGDGAAKFEEIINHANASFISENYLLASSMANLAEDEFNEKNYLDTAYFEPNYLKEFMIIPSKKKFF